MDTWTIYLLVILPDSVLHGKPAGTAQSSEHTVTCNACYSPKSTCHGLYTHTSVMQLVRNHLSTGSQSQLCSQVEVFMGDLGLGCSALWQPTVAQSPSDTSSGMLGTARLTGHSQALATAGVARPYADV